MKRIISIFMVVSMVLTAFPADVFAAVEAGGSAALGEDFDWANYDWTRYDWGKDPLAEESERSRIPLFAQLDYRNSRPVPVKAAGAALSSAEVEQTPDFYISTAKQLKELAEYVGAGDDRFSAAHYKQTADIDLSGYKTGGGWTPIGKLAAPFMGVYDGGNRAVSNLFINRPDTDYQGLFGYVNGKSESAKAQIKNVTVRDAGIICGGNSGTAAGFCAPLTETIENCAVENGSINGGSKSNVGGIAGQAKTIKYCNFAGDVGGGASTDGIAGTIEKSSTTGEAGISCCYSTGSVSGTTGVGGIAGSIKSGGVVSCCYSTVSVSGSSNVGGAAGVLKRQYHRLRCTWTERDAHRRSC